VKKRRYRRRRPARKLIITVAVAAACLIILFICMGANKEADKDAETESGIPSVAAETAQPSVAAASSPNPTATPTPTPTPTPEPTEAPTPSPTPEPGPLEGVVIGIDPGHQAQQNSDQEPVAPGSSETKMKVSSGTAGIASGIDEHVVNLNVGLKLRDMLEEAGATVIMTRTSADVDISNRERAEIFNDAGVDLGIRLHCNGLDDESIRGAFMLIPESNPFEDEVQRAAELIIENYTEVTGIRQMSTQVRSDQTGFNWCERPVVNIEMGHMSNPDEDWLITDEDFQTTMAEGIYEGILAYFDEKE